MADRRTIGFVGVGVMGNPMGRYLVVPVSGMQRDVTQRVKSIEQWAKGQGDGNDKQ